MYSIGQSRRIRGNAGDPLPTVFDAFEEKQIVFRRGQLGLIVAGPGTGKSALALTLALRSKVPTLYMSPDSDAFTQVARSFSVLSGVTMYKAGLWARGEEVDEGTMAKAVAVSGLPIRFNYLASPDLADMERSVEAFEELYGEYPALIVIDNITNVQNGNQDNAGDPFSGLEGFLDYAHTMARETQACVIGLHHVTGPYNDANKPIPLSGVKGQVGRVPELILTVHKEISETGPDILKVSPVKNRGSRNDASGEWYAELEFNGETMSIRDPEPVEGLLPSGPGGETTDPFAVSEEQAEAQENANRRLAEEMMG